MPSKRVIRMVVLGAGAVIVALVLLRISVEIFGSWWRIAGMPTSGEWSSFLGFSAVVALVFAWFQVRQVEASNRALVASNAETQRINREMVRPKVQVALQFDRVVRKMRGAPAEGNIYIAVNNAGATTARNVRMRVDTPFDSLDTFFNEGMRKTHFSEVENYFNGSTSFSTMVPGPAYIWFLGRFPELIDDTTGTTRIYNVTVEYEGTDDGHTFHDTYLLDLDIEKRASGRIDPLERIGKDIEVVGQNLKTVASKINGLRG